MAQVRAHEADNYLKKPNPAHRVFLVYGPDRGLVSERAKKLAQNCGVDLNDPFSAIQLHADDAAADPARISDEAHTVSMFGGSRVVWIKGSTQKNLVKAIDPVLVTPPNDAIVIVEGGDLKKSAPLRSRIEKAATAMALPCYQDEVRAINGVIDEELSLNSSSITSNARKMLISLLGADRLASRGEVQKLCLYAGQGVTIDEDIVELVVGDASALAVDSVIDAAGTGNIAEMEHTLKRLFAQGTAIFQIVSSMQRHFQILHQARVKMDATRQPATAAVAAMRPPINFKRKDSVVRALSIWNSSALERMLERLDKVSLDSRANAALAMPLVATALLAISIEANRGSR